MNRSVEALAAYFQHTFHTQSKYTLHSPFIYNFYKKVLTNREEYPQYRLMHKVRRELLLKSRFIKRKDLGSKARESVCDQRFVRVRDIVRRSGVGPRKGELLFRIAQEYQPDFILELGTSLGVSTMYFSAARPESKIITIEACLDSANLARQNFDHYGMKNIALLPGSFEEKLQEALAQLPRLDMVFFDGNHRKQPTLRYFEQCLQHIHPGSVFILDDIHWSAEMSEAWSTIQRHSQVKVTIDLYHLGLVFFREELSKEDFRLKF